MTSNSKTIDLAYAAKRLVENDDFTVCMGEIERLIFNAFQTTNIGDAETLANVHALSHGFRLIQMRLNNFIDAPQIDAQNEENY